MAKGGFAFMVTIPGLVAAENLATHQYKAVKFATTAGQVKRVNATTDNAIGLLQNDPTAGQPALVATAGSIAIAIAGVNDVAQGERLGFNTTGQLVDHTSDNRRILALALEASTGVGDEIMVSVSGLTRF